MNTLDKLGYVHHFRFIGGEKEIVTSNDQSSVEIKTVDVDGYLTVCVDYNGKPVNLFLTVGKQGDRYAVYDVLMSFVSKALQSGESVESCMSKFMHLQFEPSGMTTNPEIPMAKSILDYIARWMMKKFGKE